MSETKIEEFVRRLNESPKKLASGPFRSEAWRYLHHIYSGDHVAGIIHEDGRLTIMAPIGTGAFVLLHETWRSLDAPPEIPPRVQRFLEALAEYETLPEGPKAAGAAFAEQVRLRQKAEELVDRALAGALKA